MFTIHIGEREFQIADNETLSTEINKKLGEKDLPIEVTFKGTLPDTYVGGVARLAGRLIEPLITTPHTLDFKDTQNEKGVTSRTDIIYSSPD